jgi:hypothetical protein
MKRAETWSTFDNILAVVGTAVIIAVLFCSVRSNAQEGHSTEHQMAHGAYHQLYNDIMRPDIKTASCCSNQDCSPTEASGIASGCGGPLSNMASGLTFLRARSFRGSKCPTDWAPKLTCALHLPHGLLTARMRYSASSSPVVAHEISVGLK